MEPRARIGKTRGQQSFSDGELQHFLFAHGDSHPSLDPTKRVLDEILTDFITEICFEAGRAAQVAGRQKTKLDDIKFACRKNPQYLGKIEEIFSKKADIDKTKKLFNEHDDKLTKGTVLERAKGLDGGEDAMKEEPLGVADDDIDFEMGGGKSNGSATGR
ncbi:TBP-associated factor 13 [Hyphodiscus hymeniophilus]|uniref:Transcription initiation factor TFIID subunit 13 n=1 Tax=Hyphodiscus hymeniophilus TaxID=353542 RepID=A0A9P7B0T3_9HELO|nr:TBP-associated factor 13 [Hyphodiscus hymeniophilus]